MVVIVQLVFTVALALILSALSVLFRDIKDILANLLTLWFFATPIIYPWFQPSVQKFHTFFDVNPFTHLAVTYQEVLFFNQGPVGHWKWLLGISAAVRWCCSSPATGCSIACATRLRRPCDNGPPRHGDTEEVIRGLRGLRGFTQEDCARRPASAIAARTRGATAQRFASRVRRKPADVRRAAPLCLCVSVAVLLRAFFVCFVPSW